MCFLRSFRNTSLYGLAYPWKIFWRKKSPHLSCQTRYTAADFKSKELLCPARETFPERAWRPEGEKVPAQFPLSYAQQRLWFLDKLEGSSAEYNIREAWRLLGELDCAALERALNAVIARHEILRTYLVEEDGEPSQVIEPAVYLPVAVEDVSALTKDDREQTILENSRAEAERSFDLGRGPLAAGAAAQAGRARARLFLHLPPHHL